MGDQPPVLAADTVGVTLDEAGRRWPTVTVDVGAHPEIADLARVHAVGGIGDIRTTALRVQSATGELFLLGIALRSPVRAAFAVAFPLPDHEAFLAGAAEAGHLVLATTSPDRAGRDRPLWLAVDLDRDALHRALRG